MFWSVRLVAEEVGIIITKAFSEDRGKKAWVIRSVGHSSRETEIDPTASWNADWVSVWMEMGM